MKDKIFINVQSEIEKLNPCLSMVQTFIRLAFLSNSTLRITRLKSKKEDSWFKF